MRTLFIGWISALGLCVGSFLSVVTSRIPVGGSMVSPPSACPGCGARIRWYDNIPVLSWIGLRGRCRHCSMTIPIRYPALELGVGAVFGLIGLMARPVLVPMLLAAAAGAIATVTAWRVHGRVSQRIVVASVILAALVAAATGALSLAGAM